MKFKIKRFDGKNIRYDVFDIKVKPNISVLEALFQIQDENDSSLCFRYSCRGAVCGSCAMLINKKPRLACRTLVSEVNDEKTFGVSSYGAIIKPEIKIDKGILIEPLPNLPLIKDLIVDMDDFFKHYKEIKPWFSEIEVKSNEEILMSIEDVKKVDSFAGCILCGLCYGSCPSVSRNKDFKGPAALAKTWRFYADTRNSGNKEILKRVDNENGVWLCNRVYRCVEVCPKNVPPTNAITSLIIKIILNRFKVLR